ncbi:tape measure protein [Microbacterium phage PauloDiaboli]|nr:tape measure protein [Microbacterium phage PauloDiaboli]
MVSLGNPVYIPVRAITNKFGDDVTRGLRGSSRQVQRNGEDLGRAFTAGFNKGVDVNAFRRVSNGLQSMLPGAVAAQKSFASLIRYSYTLSTALTGVVGGASAAISSIGALAGAAGGAVATVATLGNAFFALGTGMAAVRLATSGVGGALKKLQQQTSQAGATGTRTALQAVRDSQARESAARRVEDAERSLARVIESNRDRLAAANLAVADAQRDLNRAILDGREELQQLGFDAEDAAINEQRAAIELERARETLARVQDLPPNSRARREAELAYAEAELNYRKAKDSNSDLQKEQDRLAKSGVNGLQSVIDARNNLADAEVDRAKTAKDALEEEADAQRNLNEAKKDAANVDDRQDAAGGGGAAGAAAAAGAAWDEGLNAAQRKFVLFLNSLKPQFDELNRIAAEAFLPDLQTAIEILMAKAYPVVAQGIGTVANSMGTAVITLANFITTGENLAKLNTLFDSSGRIIETMGSILGRTYGIVLSILTATAPIAEKFFTFVDGQLALFDAHLNSVEGNQQLVTFFERASQTAELFGDIFANIFEGVGAVIDANMGEGTGGWIILEYIKEATSTFGNSDNLKQFFADVATNATHVMDTLGNLAGALGDLGANQNIGKAFEILNKPENVEALNNILQLTADAAPQLATLFGILGQIVSALSDTGAMQVFFETLTNILTPILDFVSDPANKEFMDFWGRIFAMFSAVGLVLTGVGTGFKIFAGIIVAILQPFALITSALKVFTALKAGAMAASYGMAGATYAVGAAQKIAWAATVLFNGSLFKAIGLKVKDIAQTAILTGMYAKDAAVKGLVAAKTVAITVAQKAATAAQWLFNAALNANPIGLIVAAITALVAGLVWFFTQTDLGREIWANFTKFLVEAWENTTKWIGEALNNLGSFFSTVWDNIVNGINAFVAWVWDIFLNWTIYGLIIQNWDAIVLFFQETWANIMGFFDAAFKWIDTYVLQPMGLAFQAVGWAFEQVGNFIGEVWTNIQNAINTVWQWINRYIFAPIKLAINLVQLAFAYAGAMIAKTWDDMMKALDIVWQWIDDNIFDPIKTAVGLVQQAFENVADGIATAWDGIKKAAAVPINFVIDTVYNNGLRSFWNDIAGNFGMNDLKLPKVNKIAFASGGVMPGYSPGKDIHKFYSPTGGFLHLSGGEAIMRPEWTRAVGGPAAVARMNRAARSGQAFANGGVYSGPRVQRFANGGTTNFGGDFLDGLGDIMAAIGDFFVDPIAAVKKHLIDGMIKPLMSGAGDNVFTQLVGGVPVKIAENIGKAFTDFFGGSGGVKGTEGMGWQAMSKLVTSTIPGARITSAYRPGSITVNGGKSYHGSGRAIDVVPATMDTFNKMLALFPNAKELIFSPAGGRQLLNGKPHMWGGKVRDTHWDHVHAAMAKGGTVYPSKDGTIVQVAEAGRAERIEPLDEQGLSDRDKAWAAEFTKGMRGNTVINVYQQPGEDGEALAQRLSRIMARDIRMGAES